MKRFRVSVARMVLPLILAAFVSIAFWIPDAGGTGPVNTKTPKPALTLVITKPPIPVTPRPRAPEDWHVYFPIVRLP